MDGIIGVKQAAEKTSSSHCFKVNDHRLLQ